MSIEAPINVGMMPIIVSDKNELRRCVIHVWTTYDGLGLNLKNSKSEGLVPHTVRDVDFDSPAQYAGVLNDDFILKVGARQVEYEKFDLVLKLIKEQLKRERKVDLLLVNASYYGEFKRRNVRPIGNANNSGPVAEGYIPTQKQPLNYNDPAIVAQIKYYESPLQNPNAALPVVGGGTTPRDGPANYTEPTQTKDQPPEPRLCHLLIWRNYDGYGFFVAYSNGGYYVKNVEPNSPAQLGGLRAYDRILEVNGRAVQARDKDFILREVTKHKHKQQLTNASLNQKGYTSMLKSQSTHSIASNKSTGRKSRASSTAKQYLDLLVVDPSTYKWLMDRRINISTRNKHLKIRECFTPAEHTLLNLFQQSEAQEQKQTTSVAQPTAQPDQIPRSLVLKKCTVRRIYADNPDGTQVPLGFEMTKRGNKAHFISRVEPSSAAALSGLCVDDYLIEINERNCEDDENSALKEKMFKYLQPEHGGQFSLTTINKPGYDYCLDNNMPVSDFIQRNKRLMQYFEAPRQQMQQQQVTGSQTPSPPHEVISKSNQTDNTKPSLADTPPNVLIAPSSKHFNEANILSPDYESTVDKPLPRLCTLHKTPNTRELGFSIARIRNVEEHIINDVVADSLAERAGLRVNDHLIEVNGENVEALSHADTVGRIVELSRQPSVDISLLVMQRPINVAPMSARGDRTISDSTLVEPSSHAKIVPTKTPEPRRVPERASSAAPGDARVPYITAPTPSSKMNSASLATSTPSLSSVPVAASIYPEIRVCEFVNYPRGTQLGLVITSDDYSHDIVKVADDSPAAKAGMCKGDVILSVNDVSVEGDIAAIELLNEFSETQPLRVLVASRYAYEWSKLLRIRITEKDWPNTRRIRTTRSSNSATLPITVPQQSTYPSSIYTPTNFSDTKMRNGNNNITDLHPVPVYGDRLKDYSTSQIDTNYYRQVPLQQPSASHNSRRNQIYQRHSNLTPSTSSVHRPQSALPTSLHHRSHTPSYYTRNETPDLHSIRSATLSRSAVDITADGKVLRMCTLLLNPDSPLPVDAEFGFDLVTKVRQGGAAHSGVNTYNSTVRSLNGYGDYYIDTVDDMSPANLAGLKSGDRLVEVDGIDVKQKTFEQVVQLINEAKLRCKLKLLVYPSVIINYGNPQISTDFESTQVRYQQQQQQQFKQPYDDHDSALYNNTTSRSHYEANESRSAADMQEHIYNSQVKQRPYSAKSSRTTSTPIASQKLKSSSGVNNSYTTLQDTGAGYLIENIDRLTQSNDLRPVPRLCTLYKSDQIHSLSAVTLTPASSNIGFGVHSGTNDQDFLKVSIVNYKSPAYLAGLEAGDAICEVNGRSILDMTAEEALHFIKDSYDVNKYVKLLVASDFCLNVLREEGALSTLRSDDPSVFSYADYLKNNHRFVPRLCKIKLFPFSKSFGFSLDTLLVSATTTLNMGTAAAQTSPPHKSYAHIVVKVDKNSPALTSSLQKGDRIIECNGVNVENESEQQITDRIYQALVVNKQINLFVVDPDTDNFFKSKFIKLHSMLPIVQHITNSTDI